MLKSQFDWAKKDKVIKATLHIRNLTPPTHLPWNTNTLDLFLIPTASWWNLCVTDLFICHTCKLHEKVFPGSLNEEHPVLIRATHGGRVKNNRRIRDERPPSALSGAPHVLGMDTEAASTSLYGIWAESHLEKERKSIHFCRVCVNSGDLFRVQVGNVLSSWCCDQECRGCSIKLIATCDT